ALEGACRVALAEDTRAVVAELEPADGRLPRTGRDALDTVARGLAIPPDPGGTGLRHGVRLAVHPDPGVADPDDADRPLALHATAPTAVAQHARPAVAVLGEVEAADPGQP